MSVQDPEAVTPLSFYEPLSALLAGFPRVKGLGLPRACGHGVRRGDLRPGGTEELISPRSNSARPTTRTQASTPSRVGSLDDSMWFIRFTDSYILYVLYFTISCYSLLRAHTYLLVTRYTVFWFLLEFVVDSRCTVLFSSL